MNLKPGTRCEIVRSPCFPNEAERVLGLRCTVLGVDRSLIGLLAISLDKHTLYVVDMDDGTQASLCEHMLKPIDERGDWNEIERVTGYKPPTHQPVAA
jgi:hypothetical protein